MKSNPRLIAAVCAAGLALAGCVEAEPTASGDSAGAGAVPPDTPVSSGADPAATDATPSGEPGDCSAEDARRFIGEQASQATRAKLLEAVAPVTAVRWVGPGDATTEDYSPSRLNVMLDAGGIIRSAHCG